MIFPAFRVDGVIQKKNMQNALLLKYEKFVRLSSAERAALASLTPGAKKRLRAKEDIVREGASPQFAYLILSGWACRYKTLEDGRRQIIAFLLPGDLCDLNAFSLRSMDHSIGALTDIEYVEAPKKVFDQLGAEYPRITQAMIWDGVVAASIQREWTVNLGQRTASERMAHLFCEIYLRLDAIDMAHDGRIILPLTQIDLADTVGISAVHVNRILQDLRARGLIQWRNADFHIPDLQTLMRVGLFNPNYLHYDREGAHLDANE